MSPRQSDVPVHRLRAPIIVTIIAVGALWFAFFDSYSLTRRIRWHREYVHLTQENERLRQEVKELEIQLEAPPTDEMIEQIAREQYGMRRPDETVYPVEEMH